MLRRRGRSSFIRLQFHRPSVVFASTGKMGGCGSEIGLAAVWKDDRSKTSDADFSQRNIGQRSMQNPDTDFIYFERGVNSK
jgi:hypothetical protein